MFFIIIQFIESQIKDKILVCENICDKVKKFVEEQKTMAICLSWFYRNIGFIRRGKSKCSTFV